MDFKVGDVVELKSGFGPTMSGRVPANHVVCVWFDGGNFARDAFPIDVLMIHDRKKWEDKGCDDTRGESDGADDELIPL